MFEEDPIVECRRESGFTFAAKDDGLKVFTVIQKITVVMSDGWSRVD